MLSSLISMNKMLNQNRFRMYPKTGPVLEAPIAPLPAGIDILFDWPCLMQSNDVDVGRGSQCSPTNGHQEVDEVVVHSRRDIDEVVVQGASSRVKTLPKNLITHVPCRTFSEQRFRRPALARAVRAALAMGMAESSSRRREMSPKQEYLKQECLCCEDEWRRAWFI